MSCAFDPSRHPDIVAVLHGVALLRGLTPVDVALLTAGADLLALADGEAVFLQGQPAQALYLVVTGHVEVSRGHAGGACILEIVGPGAILGETALVTGAVHGEGGRAVGAVRLLRVPAAGFRAVLDRRFDLAQRMLATMSMRLRGLIGQIADLKLKTTAQRLGGFLLGLAEVDCGRAEIRFPYDKRLAAQVLGMTPESLSRALTRLGPLGVDSTDNLVVIADLDRLRDFCQGGGE